MKPWSYYRYRIAKRWRRFRRRPSVLDRADFYVSAEDYNPTTGLWPDRSDNKRHQRFET